MKNNEPPLLATKPKRGGNPFRPGAAAVGALTDSAVVNFLKNQRDFLVRYPELVDMLSLPSRGAGNVSNLHDWKLKKLQQKAEKLEQKSQMLLKFAHHNLQSLEDVHALTLNLISCRTLASFKNQLTRSLTADIGAESVRLWLIPELGKAADPAKNSDDIEDLYEAPAPVRLRSLHEESPRWMHDAEVAAILTSDALLRLTDSTGRTMGLLAIGSTDATKFHQGQATELLNFFAGVVGTCVERLVVRK